MRKKYKKTIAFIGIDGSGKTTIMEEVEKELKKLGEESKPVYMGLGGNFTFPFLRGTMKFYSNIKYRQLNKIRKKELKQDNWRERGFFWVLVQYIELWTRWIKYKLFSKRKIILFDRFFYDGLVLTNEKNFHFFKKITPKPDICFMPVAPPEIIRERKDEASKENIKNFYKKAELLKKHFKIEVIDNTKLLEEVIKEVMEKIKNE